METCSYSRKGYSNNGYASMQLDFKNDIFIYATGDEFDWNSDIIINTTITETKAPEGYNKCDQIRLQTKYDNDVEGETKKVWITKVGEAAPSNKDFLTKNNPYDLNGDGIMNWDDTYEQTKNPQVDANGDGEINRGDAVTMQKWISTMSGIDIEGEEGENATARGDYLVISNEKEALPNFELNLKKQVEGESNPDTSFEFDIEYLDVNRNPLNNGDDNQYNIAIKAGETIELKEVELQNEGIFYVKVTETKQSGYEAIEDIWIQVNYVEGTGWVSELIEINGNTINPISRTDATITGNNQLELKVINKKLRMKIGGTVWKDAQTGTKPALKNNNVMDPAEDKISGVKVNLYKKGSSSVLKTTNTNGHGYYEFTDLEVSSDYYVEFVYEGMNYQAVEPLAGTDMSINSKATEENREDFNEKFTTITGDPSGFNQNYAYGKANNKIGLIYSKNNNTATLITKDGNGVVKDDFVMKANTNNYSIPGTDTTNINFGLVKRELDLSLNTFFEKAEVSINGVTETFETNQIDINTIQNNEDPSYLYITKSDYNYRIRDYVSEIHKEEGKESPGKSGSELAIELTYRIELNNESINKATINQIVNYYNPNLKLKEIEYRRYGEEQLQSVSSYKDGNTVKIDGIDYKSILINGLNSTLEYGERGIIYLTFTVNEIKFGEEYTNIAEITSYSTETGMIDIDSAPDDAQLNDTIRYEDDTDEGKCIISLPTTVERTISGYVWDDKNKNGNLDVGLETKLINDVIVQLIEVRPFGTSEGNVWLEYIWQETKTGSETGTRMSTQPDDVGKFYLEPYGYNKNDGYYEFKGFIPGNYIIRFIYGDGTTYDLTSDVLKYNGQDYKSTIINAENPNSKAKDNEARRLETMAEFIEITPVQGVLLSLLDDTELTKTEEQILIDANTELTETEKQILKDAGFSTGDLEKLQKDILDKTWMCAETNSIEVPVSINKDWKDTDQYLGLAKRPAPKLVLEKHLTGLKIQPNAVGVNPIIDLTQDNALITGLGSDRFSKIASTRRERGEWKVEVDIQELMQGASLEATYKYNVKNDGEEDYISENLALVFGTMNSSNYSNFLTEKSKEVKTIIRNGQDGRYLSNYEYTDGDDTWLGKDYYTGNKAGSLVGTNALGIEESVNPKMSFIESKNTNADFELIENNSATDKNIYDIDGNFATETIRQTIKSKEATGLIQQNSSSTPKQVILSTTTSVDDDLVYDSYIAQIMTYSNAVGRRDTESIPGNLEYVHSYDKRIELEENNEPDEAWAERILITTRPGEDKSLNTQTIILITATGIMLIGVGIILIKKYVIK